MAVSLEKRFQLSVDEILNTTNFVEIYNAIDLESSWSPITLLNITQLTLFKMERTNRHDDCAKLQSILNTLRDEEIIAKISKHTLLYFVSFLEKLNNRQSTDRIGLYN